MTKLAETHRSNQMLVQIHLHYSYWRKLSKGPYFFESSFESGDTQKTHRIVPNLPRHSVCEKMSHIPKRSFSSISANSNNSSSSNGKRKKSNQKTLGMAWGANSVSSSRSSFRSSPFSNFGSYMEVKNQKLHNQFDAEVAGSSHSGPSSGNPIFRGVAIFVDGFTVPSSQELRGYMVKHGGRFENYFSRHRVTHIICSNLPDSKIKNLRSFSGGLPVVKPSWVLESVTANRLLSWVPYQLDQVASNQPKLSAFLAMKNCQVVEDSLNAITTTTTTCQVIPEIKDSTLRGDTPKDAKFSAVDKSLEHEMLLKIESDEPMPENDSSTMIKELSSGSEECHGAEMENPSNVNAEDNNVETKVQPSPQQPSGSVSAQCSDDQNAKNYSRSAVTGSHNQRHSTLGDPNFVENYFKYSRLHFIGTWRNRYRKRFPSMSIGSKCSSSNGTGLANSRKSAVIHIDMDCFFVSVVVRNHPELQNKPVAVCHSDNPKGTAEISSANYPARDSGVKAGMFVRDAKALCPQLVIVPYNFEAYEEVADQFYNTLHKHCNRVQAVSCDEAFLEVMDYEEENLELLASAIRKEILDSTGCTASAGIAGNMLMARLATRTAKPDGQFYIPPEKVDDYLHQLPIKALPGIGRVLEERLEKKNITTCGQLRLISKGSLQKDFGMKTGEMLWNYCRGFDNRLVGMIQESKSIGAEVNWGVRFKEMKDCQHFLLNLCKEVSLRLQGCVVQGRTFTLKIKKRRNNAQEPTKYMGHGDCENLSHSITVPAATDDVEVLQRITKQLFGSFHVDVKDVRGIGLQVSKLENVDTVKQGLERNSLKSWLTSATTRTELSNTNHKGKEKAKIDQEEQNTDKAPIQLHANSVDSNLFDSDASPNQVPAMPPLYDLDLGVIESLPPELFAELNQMYGGKLNNFVVQNKSKAKNSNYSSCAFSEEPVKGTINEGQDSHFLDQVIAVENQHAVEEVQRVTTSVSGAGPSKSNTSISTSGVHKTDLMPSSLSQVDTSVLQQLPEDLKADILELLPAHRVQEFCSNSGLGLPTTNPQEQPLDAKSVDNYATVNWQRPLDIKSTGNQFGSADSVSGNNIFSGNPPRWVDQFRASSCLILNVLADMFYKAGSTDKLSSILQCTISKPQHHIDLECNGWDEAVGSLYELFRQYVKLKIANDIEEIYVCFRLLKRLAVKSAFFSEVFDVVSPYLQARVSENYGGNLHIS